MLVLKATGHLGEVEFACDNHPASAAEAARFAKDFLHVFHSYSSRASTSSRETSPSPYSASNP